MEKERRVKTLSLVTLIVAVLGLTVAFAALSQTLTINGTANVNAAEWDIHFENLSEPEITGDASEISKPLISNGGISIENIKVNLKKPKDKVTYTVDIVNSGSITAEISSISTTKLTAEQEKIIDFNVTYSDGKPVSEKDILKPKERHSVIIKITFKEDIEASDLPKEAMSVNLGATINYVQSDGNTNTPGTTTPSDNKTYNVGDEIALGEEHFYVISDNGDMVTALAKYNLNVGPNKDNTTTEGIQNEKVNGSIEFASSKYWSDSGLKEKYGTSYPAFVYDSNSTLYSHVQNYQSYLRNTVGKKSVTATLISQEQLVSLGCKAERLSCEDAPNWVYLTSYWTGSAVHDNSLYRVTTKAIFGYEIPTSNNIFGIRPVITISKTEL